MTSNGYAVFCTTPAEDGAVLSTVGALLGLPGDAPARGTVVIELDGVPTDVTYRTFRPESGPTTVSLTTVNRAHVDSLHRWLASGLGVDTTAVTTPDSATEITPTHLVAPQAGSNATRWKITAVISILILVLGVLVFFVINGGWHPQTDNASTADAAPTGYNNSDTLAKAITDKYNTAYHYKIVTGMVCAQEATNIHIFQCNAVFNGYGKVLSVVVSADGTNWGVQDVTGQ